MKLFHVVGHSNRGHRGHDFLFAIETRAHSVGGGKKDTDPEGSIVETAAVSLIILPLNK